MELTISFWKHFVLIKEWLCVNRLVSPLWFKSKVCPQVSFQIHNSMLAHFRRFHYPNLSCVSILRLCAYYVIYYSTLNQVWGVINDWSLDVGDDIFMRSEMTVGRNPACFGQVSIQLSHHMPGLGDWQTENSVCSQITQRLMS